MATPTLSELEARAAQLAKDWEAVRQSYDQTSETYQRVARDYAQIQADLAAASASSKQTSQLYTDTGNTWRMVSWLVVGAMVMWVAQRSRRR